MNKKIKNMLLTLVIASVAIVLMACGGASESDSSSDSAADSVETTEETNDENADNSETITEEDTNIVVASHLEPMTDIVEIAADVIEEPYTIELMNVSDNIQYNEAVFNDEAYASLAQHEPFMEQFNQERDADLVAIQPIYNAIVGFYSPVYDSEEDIEEGAEVAIPSDATNEARALQLLASHDLITLDEEADPFFVTVNDITENPMNFEFTHIDLLNLPAAYEDGVDLVFNYPTYVEPLGLTTDDAILLEPEEYTMFAQTLVIRDDNLDTEKTQALVNAFTSQEVYDFVADLAEQGHLYPAFEDPSDENPESEESSEE